MVDDDPAPGEFQIVRDVATGKAVHVRLPDGSLRVLCPLTVEQIEEFERFLSSPPAPRH